jgi:hypothetical protein
MRVQRGSFSVNFLVANDRENKNGKPQAIDFQKIEDQDRGVKTPKLNARSDSGLPVQFFVVSGAVELKDDDSLAFLPIPPRSKYPVRVIMGVYQWAGLQSKNSGLPGPYFRKFPSNYKMNNRFWLLIYRCAHA